MGRELILLQETKLKITTTKTKLLLLLLSNFVLAPYFLSDQSLQAKTKTSEHEKSIKT